MPLMFAFVASLFMLFQLRILLNLTRIHHSLLKPPKTKTNFLSVSVMTTKDNLPTAIKLLYFTIAMFVLPLLTYFSVNKVFNIEYIQNSYQEYALVVSVSLSVLVVNLIIGSYVYMAFQEEDDNYKIDEAREGQFPSVGVFKKQLAKKRRKERSD